MFITARTRAALALLLLYKYSQSLCNNLTPFMHSHPRVLASAVERGQPERGNLICCLSLVAVQHLQPSRNVHSSSTQPNTGPWGHASGGEGLHPRRDGAQGLGHPRCRTGCEAHPRGAFCVSGGCCCPIHGNERCFQA